MHGSRHPKAESIIETIIAIMVIVLAISAAMGMLRSSILGNSVIGAKTVALNLAIEGIEAVENVRDTNYLRFASDPDNCWNKLNMVTAQDCAAPGAEEITAGTEYYLYRDFLGNAFEWELRPTDAVDTGDIDLYEVDMDLDATFESKIYAQSGLTGVFINSLESAPFNRVLDFSYSAGPDVLTATVTVSWTENGLPKNITLIRSIPHVY